MLERSRGLLEPNLVNKLGEGGVPIQKRIFFPYKLLGEKE
jgi:hypothetical protein